MAECIRLSLALDDPLTQTAADLVYEGIFHDVPPSDLDEAVTSLTAEGQVYYGVVEDDALLAAGALFLREEGGTEAYIDTLVVDEMERGRGLGRTMLLHLEKTARSDTGIARITLSPTGESQTFYERLGYRPHPTRGGHLTKRLRR